MKRPAKAKAKAKTKGKAKAATPKRASAKPTEKVTPNYLDDGKSLRMNLHDVIKVTKMIEKHGHLDRFTRKLKSAPSEVLLPASTVNLVKNFVADNGLHTSAMGKHIVYGRRQAAPSDVATTASFTADDGDPNQCQFGRAERS